MEIAERIEKRMKRYGYNTLEEMLKAIEEQEPLDISIFTSPIEGVARNEEKMVKLA